MEKWEKFHVVWLLTKIETVSIEQYTIQHLGKSNDIDTIVRKQIENQANQLHKQHLQYYTTTCQ